MLAQLYSVTPLKPEYRTTFEMPRDPYDLRSIEDRDVLNAYLKKLGIFYYRDEEYGDGHIVDPEFLIKKNFHGFKSLVELDDEGKPREFKATFTQLEARRAKHGDIRMWLIWNRPLRIHQVTPALIRFS